MGNPRVGDERIFHRDYELNAPIQFYQYADCTEIENHEGLYGRANEQNFPNVNDYRNLIVAEGMKVLGIVNRQSRGVLKVQRELLYPKFVLNEAGAYTTDTMHRVFVNDGKGYTRALNASPHGSPFYQV